MLEEFREPMLALGRCCRASTISCAFSLIAATLQQEPGACLALLFLALRKHVLSGLFLYE
jgi:hypothetical protein